MSSQYTIHRSLPHLHCLGNVRYFSPRCCHPNDLPSLADGTFPHDEVKLTGHKKLIFGVAKVVLVSTLLFKDHVVNFTHFARHVTRYIHIILTFFQEKTQCQTLWKISLEKFARTFFQGCMWQQHHCQHSRLIKVGTWWGSAIQSAGRDRSVGISYSLRQDDRHFVKDILKAVFLNENVCKLIKISLKFASKGPVKNNPASV